MTVIAPATPPSDATARRAALPSPAATRPPIDPDALRARLQIASDDFFVLYTELHRQGRLGGD